MRNFNSFLVGFATMALICLPAEARHRGNATPVVPPSSVYPCTYYSGFSNGVQSCTTTFPVLAWLLTNPAATTGYSVGPATIAKALAAQSYTGLQSLNGAGPPTWWPEHVGSDNGEAAAIAAAGIKLIGGPVTDYTSSTTVNSPQSMRTTMAGAGIATSLWGYSLGDEPLCSGTVTGPDVGQYPTAVTGIHTTGADTTRMIFANFTYNYSLFGTACDSSYLAAINAVDISSMDLYPMQKTFAFNAAVTADNFTNGGGAAASDGADTMFLQEIAVANLVNKNTGHPVWPFVDGMNNSEPNGGVATGAAANIADATVTNTSTLLTIRGFSNLYPAKLTTYAGNGLTVSDSMSNPFAGGGCIQVGTTITVTSTTTATMSLPATCSKASFSDTVTFAGGDGGGGCTISKNLCEPMLNEYRTTAAQYYAEVYISILAGAYGIQIFPNDTLSDTFSFGDPAGGAAAAAAVSNITSVNAELQTDAPILNRPRDKCSMQSYTLGSFTTATSCTTPNGVIVATGTAALPGLINVITPAAGGGVYLYVMTDRNSAAGATFTYTLGASFAAATATICRDSRTAYDPANAKTIGATTVLNGSGVFSDTIATGGTLNDNYNVLKYAIGRAC